jgi:hypothetical protein
MIRSFQPLTRGEFPKISIGVSTSTVVAYLGGAVDPRRHVKASDDKTAAPRSLTTGI